MFEIVLGFLTAFFVVLLATPSLIKVAKLKHLVDEPGEERKLHRRSVPTIGGIIIFAAIIFAYALWIPQENRPDAFGGSIYGEYGYIVQAFSEFKYIVASLIILFFVGVKDDIIGTSPVKKLIGHIIVAFILVMMAEIRITNMHGIFGVHDMPDWASVMLSVFVYIVIVNAYNLIDGVDGLAAGIGFVNACVFGIWFYFSKDLALSLLSFVLAGALLGFLIFNFSPAKIFMGDSGSLTIGLIISVLSIRLIEHDTAHLPFELYRIPTPVFAMAVLVYPLIDTLRIFIYRAAKGLSPFSADKNHIHHRLIRLGLGHGKTVIILYLFTLVVVATPVILGLSNPTYCFISTAAIAVILATLPTLFKPRKESAE